jgi:hypothetical protein
MDRFFSQKNIERYRMLANPRHEAQRRMILKLLAKEGAKLKERPAQAREPPQRAVLNDPEWGRSEA